MYTEIKKCRICGNSNLVSILNLGNQYLTGVFPKSKSERLTSGPLELVKCNDEYNDGVCGLVQLQHSYNHHEMYGDNYGYRSGLNKSMVKHLHGKVEKIQSFLHLAEGDMVIDVGSNDSTLLQGYRQVGLLLVGIDPTGKKFKRYYPKQVHLIPDFFSAEAVKRKFGNRKARVVTSIAMFYDLESPVDFAKQIKEVLADDGIWVFEQSYMPIMLEMKAYDTICHEHIEYYCLKQIKWIMDKVGLKIIDIEFNNVNGGSFSVTAAKQVAPHKEKTELIRGILFKEEQQTLNKMQPYEQFKRHVSDHRMKLLKFIKQLKGKNKKLFGYGASTKGNVILQYCNISENDISCIAEVNSDKFNCYTPGTNIPIISEEEARKMKPDYFMVLPWHFRDNIIEREKDYLAAGGKLLFPLPSLEVV